MHEHILATIRRFPGIHLRGIVKELDTSTALARYHLDQLLADGDIREYEVGGFTRYFPAEAYKELTEAERRMLHVLRQERPLEIVLALLEFGPMQHRDILGIVGGSKATLSYQLDKLVDAGILEKTSKGPDRGFALLEVDHVRSLLARYQPVPAVYKEVSETWDDLFSGHRSRR